MIEIVNNQLVCTSDVYFSKLVFREIDMKTTMGSFSRYMAWMEFADVDKKAVA